MRFEKPKSKVVFSVRTKKNKRVTDKELLKINQELYKASSTVWRDEMFSAENKIRL